MPIVGEDYFGVQTSKKNFTYTQRARSRLVNELPEEGLSPRLVNSYWTKFAAFMICHDETTKDWLTNMVHCMVAYEGAKIKLFALEALPS
jgi:hypothetical protein